MQRLARAVAAAPVASAVSMGAPAPAPAGRPSPGDPCANDVAHLATAQDALARVTAVLVRQRHRLEAARAALATASTHTPEINAQQALECALARHDAATSARTAQHQRVGEDQQRLDQCRAARSTS